MFKVLIADDHPLFRSALRHVVERMLDGCEILEAGTLEEAERLVMGGDEVDLDLVMLDLQMPGASGFSGLVRLRNAAPTIPIVVVSAMTSKEVMRDAITYGAAGFIPKSLPTEMIGEGMAHVLSGDVYLPPDADDESLLPGTALATRTSGRIASLTHGELRVLELLVGGKPNKIIAYELGIRESTVKAHITAILRKLKVHSRTQAVLAARDFDFARR